MASRTLGRWGQCLPPGRDAVQRVEYAGGRDGVEHIKIAEDQRENRIDQAERLAGEERTVSSSASTRPNVSISARRLAS